MRYMIDDESKTIIFRKEKTILELVKVFKKLGKEYQDYTVKIKNNE